MKKLFTLLFFLFGIVLCAADLDVHKYYARGGKVELIKIDNQNAVRLTVPAKGKAAYLRYRLTVEPGKNYRLTVYFRGKNLKPRPSKSMKGAGIFLTERGKVLFRGSDLGRWKHHLGDFALSKIEVPFRSKKAKDLYLTLEIASAEGVAEFSGLALKEAAPVKKKVMPQLTAGIFPVDFQKGIYYISRNMPAVWNFVLNGTKRPKAPKLELELPVGVECIGASPVWPVDMRAKVWKFEHDYPVKKAIIRNGKKYVRYTLTIGKGARNMFKGWKNDYRVYLKSNGTVGNAYWRLTDGKFVGQYKKVELRDAGKVIYPEKPMQKFKLFLCAPMNFYGGMPAMDKAYSAYWHKLDPRPYARTWHIAWAKMPKADRDRFVKEYYPGMIMLSTGSYGLTRYLKQRNLPHNYRLQVPRSSRDPKDTLCPEELIADRGGHIWDGLIPHGLRQTLKGLKPHFIDFDFEPGAMGHCFCEVCRAKFSKPIKTRAQILANHRKAWFDFRLKQHAEIARKFFRMVHKHFPGSLAVMCTDPLHVGASPLAEWCGVDPRMFDKDGVDLYMNMPYFEGLLYFDSMKLNVETLTGAPHFPMVDPTEEIERYFIRYTPGGVRTLMVATAANGGIGQAFWPSDYFDGRFLVSIAEGASLIAKAENFYLSGKRVKDISFKVLNTARHNFKDNGTVITVESPDFRPTTRFTTHEYKGKKLLTLFNYHPRNAMIAKIAVPKGMYARELNSNRALNKSNTVQIGSGGVALIEFSNKPYKLPELPSYDKALANFKSDKPIGSYGMLRPEKLVLPRVSGGKSSVYVDTDKNGNVIGWTTPGQPDPLFFKDRGYLGDFIAHPSFGEKIWNYKITAPGCFEYQIPPPDDANPDADPYEGLIIRKRYSLEENGKVLKAVFEMENASPRKTPMKLRPRIRNIIKLGGRLAGSKSLSEVITVEGKPVGSLGKTRPMKGNTLTASVVDGAMRDDLVFMLDSSFKNYFCWTNGNLVTVEPGCDAIVLPYGAKKVYTARYKNGK